MMQFFVLFFSLKLYFFSIKFVLAPLNFEKVFFAQILPKLGFLILKLGLRFRPLENVF